MQRAIQIIETAQTLENAREMADALAVQDGVFGYRILPPNDTYPRYRVQCFMTDDTDGQSWLPDGMRRVVLPEIILRAMTRTGR